MCIPTQNAHRQLKFNVRQTNAKLNLVIISTVNGIVPHYNRCRCASWVYVLNSGGFCDFGC